MSTHPQTKKGLVKTDQPKYWQNEASDLNES
jgi:hypothetical protein